MEQHENETLSQCPLCNGDFWCPNHGLGCRAPCPHCGYEIVLEAKDQTTKALKPETTATPSPSRFGSPRPKPAYPPESPAERSNVHSGFLPRLPWYLFFGVIIVALGVALWNAKKAQGPKEKTWYDFSREAEPLMVADASNQIVGFRRLLHAYVNDHGDYKNPNAWTGEVEAEYINPLGGVSVTNLPYYRFSLDTGYNGSTILRCSVDWRKQSADELARTLAKLQADLDAAGKSK